ncbi:MAG: xanthine dehydrogenase accessory protein XdhC [Glaciimonas sp.]|nr:xanthine dehydrogenase accessory protein XdhC [Glaciimonas sp.]
MNMNWLQALTVLNTPAVLITVAQTEGSCPREAGAKMLVTAETQCDTIGGGHLELNACSIARDMLQLPAGTLVAERRLQRIALGPSLGQCCGGVVHLAFERTNPNTKWQELSERLQHGQDSWRVVALDTVTPTALLDADSVPLHGAEPNFRPTLNASPTNRLQRDTAGKRWLVDACLSPRPHLVLFGAGHVGAALVRALAELPCRISWIDQRDDLFPAALPANVQIEATDTPEAVIDAAAPNSCFLVMTHEHALDQRLTEHILRRIAQRNDVQWFGLIGSGTKRAQFSHRLQARGITPETLARMVCPIGLPGISGKQPAVIAASVAAQLLGVWELCGRQIQARI